MLKVAIVGCGKIADAHVSQIKRIQGAKIVAAFDSEDLMARQFAERFSVENVFCDVGQLLEKARPDVVHITTPPQSHFPIARQCLERGCHLYVEKPFTLDAGEAKQLIKLAAQKDCKLTVGHDAQYTHVARLMRSLIRDGYLGGMPLHVESTYCYNLNDAVYARDVLGNQTHWVRRLPGKLLHNVISHGVARIAEYITTDSPQIVARGFVSPFLSSLGENDIADELRVIIADGNQFTAYFTFSSQMHPSINQFRAYGKRNGLFLDESQQILIRLRGDKFKSYGEKFIPSLLFSSQYLKNFSRNLRLFLKNDFHFESGKKYLMEAFYDSIENRKPVPIPYQEILLTAQIMDEVFRQLSAKN